MQLALHHAMRGNYDFYLWLNDDTILDLDALEVLLQTRDQLIRDGTGEVVVVGATRDPYSGQMTYGGRYRPSRWRRHRFVNTGPSSQPQRIETMNRNVVLVPRAVATVVGNISNFRHSFGDEDYGLRTRQAGFDVWLAPNTVATCARNPPAVYGHVLFAGTLPIYGPSKVCCQVMVRFAGEDQSGRYTFSAPMRVGLYASSAHISAASDA